METDAPWPPEPGLERTAPALDEPAAVEEPGPLAAGQAALPASGIGILKLGIVLAIAGWIAFLYYSNDNIPVSSLRLGAALPNAPQGWRRGLTHVDNPSSVSVVGIEKFTSSSASRTYTQTGKEISIEIWDWAGDYPYHLPIDVPGWMNGEIVRVGAENGRLRYNRDTRTGRLRVRYLERFYLIVEGTGIERRELQAWYHRIDLAGLRRELGQLRSETASR